MPAASASHVAAVTPSSRSSSRLRTRLTGLRGSWSRNSM